MKTKDSIRKLLLIRTDRMGDLILTLPAVHAIRKRFPEAKLTLLIQKPLSPLLKDHPDLDQILTWDPRSEAGWIGTFQWMRRIRPHRFDAAVIFNPTRLFHVATFLAGIPTRVGYRRKWGRCLTHSIPDTKAQRPLHEPHYNLELVTLLGCPLPTGQAGSEPAVLHLPVSKEARQTAAGLLQSNGAPTSARTPIAFHPWTSNPDKSWKLEAFVEVAKRLESLGVPLVLIGKPEGAQIQAARQMDCPSQLINLVEKTELDVLAALLSSCSLLVSNDSGPVHVAAAVGTPTVVIVPKAHAQRMQRWRPLGQQHRILIDPQIHEVIDAVHQQLKQAPSESKRSCES